MERMLPNNPNRHTRLTTRETPEKRNQNSGDFPAGRTGAARTGRTSLTLPAHMPIDQWRDLGQHIYVINDSSGWWFGDWLIYGQQHYPDRYKHAIAETSLSYQTLRNYAWVAGQFGVDRRRDRLSFQHHAEVAGLNVEMQDNWLNQAERFGWSRNELRRRIKAGLRPPSEKLPANVRVDVTAERRARWERAAADRGQELSAWIISVLDESASVWQTEPAPQFAPPPAEHPQQNGAPLP